MADSVSLVAACSAENFAKACLRFQGCLGHAQALLPGLIYLRRRLSPWHGNRARTLLLNSITGTEIPGAWSWPDHLWQPAPQRKLPPDQPIGKQPDLLYGLRPDWLLTFRLISSKGIQIDGIPVPGDQKTIDGYLVGLRLPEGRGARFVRETSKRGLNWQKGLLPEPAGDHDDPIWRLALRHYFDFLNQPPSTSCSL